jgi:hypothetical protein
MSGLKTIAAAGFWIPSAWTIHWDHLSAGRTIYPELSFESLLCLTLPPETVLDFGWVLRDDGVRFVLQINRGHFGLGDVICFEEWSEASPAIVALQSWLVRLTANDI